MLSDEEKKALEQLNKRYGFLKENLLANNVWLSLDVYNLGTILNLIEKQSKEIEELKEESKEYQIGFAQGCYEKNLDWEDKIKAKIEELEKQDRENRMSHNYLVIPVLQSLLEKE